MSSQRIDPVKRGQVVRAADFRQRDAVLPRSVVGDGDILVDRVGRDLVIKNNTARARRPRSSSSNWGPWNGVEE